MVVIVRSVAYHLWTYWLRSVDLQKRKKRKSDATEQNFVPGVDRIEDRLFVVCRLSLHQDKFCIFKIVHQWTVKIQISTASSPQWPNVLVRCTCHLLCCGRRSLLSAVLLKEIHNILCLVEGDPQYLMSCGRRSLLSAVLWKEIFVICCLDEGDTRYLLSCGRICCFVEGGPC